jgi:lysyl-tRNA synthetase class I
LQVLSKMKAEKLSIAKQKAYLAQYIRDLKEKSPCMDCKEYYPYYVMDFDHVRGKKHKNVMELIPTLSKKKIDEEIAKCEVVCSNCHRIRTHIRKTQKRVS